MIYDEFPRLDDGVIEIRRMEETDVDALSEITENANVYKYIPPFLYKKSRGSLLTAIRNLGGRDFEKKKMIIAGVYLLSDPDRLVGLAEMFDYSPRKSCVTVGYRFNEAFWGKGLATRVIALMVKYLCEDCGIRTLIAHVMPENAYSGRALLKNGFRKESILKQEKNWGGRETVDVEEYVFERNED